MGAANRSNVTDFAAPALNAPTFRRESTTGSSATTSGTSTTSVANHLTFTQVGTSVSDAIVTGAYSLISSALTYWTNLAQSNGYTADAYLNTPVGTDSLNFGKHAFENLSAWNNPSGINGILAWTAVPATDANDGGSVSTPPDLPGGTTPRAFATINVANAVAAIEGSQAIHYLTAHGDWKFIDTNHDGVITAQEVQNFVDGAAAAGKPEAGAMAALLGGTATYAAVEPGINNTVFNENPDDPAAEQRRFNFFDFAADGQLNGAVTINQFKMLGRILLPPPDAFDITDRQRASANGFLLAPTTKRNFVALQRTLPQYQWVPKSAVKKYRNVSPAQFGVDQGAFPGTTFPLYTLFSPVISSSSTAPKTTVAAQKTAFVNGQNITVDYLSAVSSTSTPSTSSAGTTTTTSAPSTTSTTPTAATSTTSKTPTAATSTTSSGTTTPATSAATTPATTPTTSNTGTTANSTPASTTSASNTFIGTVLAAITGSNSSSSTGGTSTPASSNGTTT